MNASEIIIFIDQLINRYESKARKEHTIAEMQEIYEITTNLRIIRDMLQPREQVRTSMGKGRRVLKVNSKTKAEALAALDLMMACLENMEGNAGIEESVYVTNEGVAWCG